jgi:hypothetical protein
MMALNHQEPGMGKLYESITPELEAWLAAQKVFFVATAPLAAGGHINCSPKGSDTFRVLGPRDVAYLDLTGSGIETVAHLHENGRIVIMFCAFDGPPKIVRLHGAGTCLEPGHPGYEALLDRFPGNPGTRSIIRVALDRISDSCGYAVPFLQFTADRETLDKWAEKKGPTGLAAYRREKNVLSIDGLPGLGGSESKR